MIERAMSMILMAMTAVFSAACLGLVWVMSDGTVPRPGDFGGFIRAFVVVEGVLVVLFLVLLLIQEAKGR